MDIGMLVVWARGGLQGGARKLVVLGSNSIDYNVFLAAGGWAAVSDRYKTF